MLVFQLFIVSAFATALLLFPVRAVLRRLGVIDTPNARSSHTSPTVRGGGLAIVAVLAAVIALFVIRYPVTALTVMLVAFAVLAVVSFIDDLRGLKASLRFFVQLACAGAAVIALITNNGQPLTITAILFAAIAVVWITGYTNAFNFMDGINGFAGMQAMTTGVGTALMAIAAGVPDRHPVVLLSFVVAGAALGFLPHNFPRARVFMGDVSSATLGFLLAVLGYWIAQLTSWWVLFWIGLLHANFVLDTGVTLGRRALRGDRLHEAHREHFYQRLVRAGYSHTAVTLIEFTLQVLVAFAVCLATQSSLKVKVTVAVVVIAIWIMFFAFCEFVFCSAPNTQNSAKSSRNGC